MAFVNSPLPQEQQNQFGPTGQTTANPLALLPPQAAQTGGSAGQGGGAQGGGAAPSVGTPTQFGSSASRLSDYLKANQDQVQNMANQISGNLGTQFGNVKGSIDQAGQDFGNQVSSGYTPYNPDTISQVSSNTVDFAAKPENVKAFQSQLNDQYTGPTNFESSSPYAGVQENITNAVQQAGQLGSYPGLSTYLQNNVETNATPGQNTLDTVLLQGNQPAYQSIQEAAKPFGTLPDYLSSVGKTQNANVQAAQQAAPAAQAAAQAALTGQENSLGSTLAGELNAGQAAYQSYGQRVNDLIGSLSQPATQVGQQFWQANQIDPRLQGALAGISNFNMWDPSEGVSVPQAATWLSPAQQIQAPGQADVATQKDADMAQALALLSGGSYAAPVTSAGNYQIPGLPTLNQGQMGSSLYNLISNINPNFTQATGPTGALTGYQSALANLQSYLGMPVTGPQPPVAPPTTPPASGGGNNNPIPPPTFAPPPRGNNFAQPFLGGV